MKKIYAFLIISAMLITMTVTSIHVDTIAANEVPEPKTIIAQI